MNVEEGMAVREGQVLARLDDSTLQAALALARAQLEARASGRCARAKCGSSEAQRDAAAASERLRKDGLTTPADVDSAQAEVDSLDRAHRRRRSEQVKVAERQVALQQTRLDNTIIRAPFSGVAISKDAQPGEMVSPVSAGGGFTRTGICTIVDMRSLEIEVDVNESYINRVHAGTAGDGGARRLSRLADSGQGHHDGADRRSAEGHGAGAHRLQRSSIRASCPTWASR